MGPIPQRPITNKFLKNIKRNIDKYQADIDSFGLGLTSKNINFYPITHIDTPLAGFDRISTRFGNKSGQTDTYTRRSWFCCHPYYYLYPYGK